MDGVFGAAINQPECWNAANWIGDIKVYTSIEFCPTDAKGRLGFWCKPGKMSFEQMIFFTIDLTRSTVGNVTPYSNGCSSIS
jgi:hypothetical protein